MRPFYFLRHGQTDWNVAGRLQGHTDIHLNETGHAQARAAAYAFSHVKDDPITHVVASPLMRAQVTAQYIAEHLRLPLTVDERLRERHYGPLEGLTRAEIEAGDPARFHDLTAPRDWAGYRHILGGESMDVLADRAHGGALAILAEHKAERLLLVSHGTWFRGLVYRLTGAVISTDNAVPYRVEPDAANGWRVERLGA